MNEYDDNVMLTPPPWGQPETGEHEDDDPETEAGDDATPGALHTENARLADLRERRNYVVLSDDEETELAELSVPAWARDVRSFAERLEEGVSPVCYRVSEIALCDGNTLLHAPYKTGKSTLMGNLTRSLVDGSDFLDAFPVEPVRGTVCYLNRELLREQYDEWLLAQGIKNTHKVIPLYLRGMGAHPQDDDDASWLVDTFLKYDVEAVIDDTLTTSLLPGLDPNRGSVASDFTHRWDEIKAAAGIRDLFLPSHTGHVSTKFGRGGLPLGLHTRGHSAFTDWCDTIWSYVSDRKGVRHLAVTGRIREDLPPTPLSFDPDTMRLSVAGPGNPEATGDPTSEESIEDEIVTYLEANPYASKRALRDNVKGSSYDVDMALKKLQVEDRVGVRMGARNAREHYLKDGDRL